MTISDIKTKIINEKRAKLILMFGFFVLFVFLLPGNTLRMVPRIISSTAQNGYVDFSGVWDASDADGEHAIYRLDGVWEYYPNQLLAPEDFERENKPEPLYVTFPHSWKTDTEHFADASGYATYRLIGKKPAASDSVGVYSRFQFGAYKIFLNGMEVLEIGGVSENLRDYFLSYQSGNAYLCPAGGETFEIILQIQNYDHIMAGFTGSIFCGDMARVKMFTEFLLIINGMTIGFLLLLCCYFSTVYLQNRTKQLYLNFAIVTLMSLYITMTTCNEAITYAAVPLVSPHLIFKLEYITQIIAAFFSTQYIVEKYLKNKPYMRCTLILCAAIILAIAVAPSMAVSRMRIQFQIVGTSYYIMPLFLTLREYLKRRSKTALWEFISLLILISGIVFSKLGVVFWGCVDLFPIMVTLYCFIQIVVLLYYYASVEENLRKFNQTLELKIEERTKELVELNKKAEAATAAKSDFLAQMSHEIRTPMNAIIGMSDLIYTDNLDDIQKLYFTDIKKVSHSLLNIINDILDFSKIESGKFQITPVHYNFYTLIDNICSVSYFSAKSKGLRFESNIDITIPAVLFGDEMRIRQSVSNIVNNAIKYTHKGFVRFSAFPVNDGKEILFTVQDTGIGIKEEDIPRLFKLFEQLDREKNRSVKGTGLGLAICKQLTELMGGHVEVQSEYGVGSTFSIYLPLVEGDPSLVETVEAAEEVFADGADILVVDDNTINLTVAKGVLATNHIVPDTAISGREAIAMVQEKDYDIVFMDHMMPEMDGVEATAAIRALGGRFETLPIIALTANAISGTREFLINSGMNDFISKPIDRAALNGILLKWLPPHKLTEADGGQTGGASGDGVSGRPDILPELSQIPGLNAEKGLLNVGGSTDTFIIVLNQFVFDMPEYLGDLSKALAESELERYAVIAHGIKGSLNSIGAGALGDWAYALENSAREGDGEACARQTDSFSKTVRSFIEELDLILKKSGPVSPKDKQEAAAGQMEEMLERLKAACALGDCATADGITAELGELAFGEEYDPAVSEIILLAEHMDYDKVISKIDELLKNI